MVLYYLLTAVAVILLVPCLVLLVQVLAALLPPSHAKRHQIEPLLPVAEAAPVQVCLLMPAHNEAGGIVPVLQALLPQLNQHTRLLVVADNCTDATAALVREMADTTGGRVQLIERHNIALRGKGYALDYGVRYLEADPPAVVIVIDADCALSPGSAQVLAAACISSGCPAQALDLMRAPKDAPVKTVVAEFAWLVKNQVRPLGYLRLGLPCQLMGTGMAFTWGQISSVKLNTGHIAEDMQLGVELARAGTPPQFCPRALVTSFFPTGTEGLQTQRTRWEHGHLGVMVSELPRLLLQAICSGNSQLLAMALDLCVPPLALLTLMVSGLVLASAAIGLLPLVLSTVAFLTLGAAVLLAWRQFGRGVIGLRQLCSVPFYVLSKVPLYLRFLLKRQTAWVRSKRDGE